MSDLSCGQQFSIVQCMLPNAFFLPPARLADFEDPGALFRDAAAARFGKHAPGRLTQRLLRQVESSPVHSEEHTRVEIDEGVDGFFRCSVHGFMISGGR
jgi:hypothetical protein